MALPVFRAAGARSAAAGTALAVANPTGITTGDLDIMIGATPTTVALSITVNGGGAWTPMTGTPLDVAAGCRLTVWWRIFAGGDSAPTIDAASDVHCAARLCYQAGTFDTSDPFEVETTGTETTSDTSFSFAPGVSTSGADRLVLVASAIRRVPNSASVPVCTNAALTALASRLNFCTNLGTGSGFGVTEGAKAAAGSVGTFACTYAAASSKSYVAFAIKPVAASTIERSASLSATASIATAGTFWTIFERAASVTATGSIATAGQVTHVFARSATLTATASIATVGQRALQRSASVSATASITTAHRRELQRSASVTGAGSISTSAVFWSYVERSASVSATGTISTTPQRVLQRQAALSATGTISTTGNIEGGIVTHSRSASLAATGLIQTVGQFWTTFERQVSVSATATVTAVGQRALQRSASVTATATIVTVGRRDLLRASSLTAIGTVTVGFEVEVQRVTPALPVVGVMVGTSRVGGQQETPRFGRYA